MVIANFLRERDKQRWRLEVKMHTKTASSLTKFTRKTQENKYGLDHLMDDIKLQYVLSLVSC